MVVYLLKRYGQIDYEIQRSPERVATPLCDQKGLGNIPTSKREICPASIRTLLAH